MRTSLQHTVGLQKEAGLKQKAPQRPYHSPYKLSRHKLQTYNINMVIILRNKQYAKLALAILMPIEQEVITILGIMQTFIWSVIYLDNNHSIS